MVRKMESDCFRRWHAIEISEKANETASWRYLNTLFIDNARNIILDVPEKLENERLRQRKWLDFTYSCFEVNFD